MSYINQFKLIQEIVKGEKPDSKKSLTEVDRQAVINALKKNRDGLPKLFRYTDEPIEEENFARIPRKDKERLLEIQRRTQEFPEKVLPDLLELKTKYPNVPAIYNYISAAYLYSRQMENYFNSVKETFEKFPNYLFAKTALAEYYINNNKYKEIPGILDGKFDIHMHYPPTKEVFHISEVRAFYSVAGIYFARIGKLARALLCYFILEDAEPDHFVTRRLGDEIIFQEIEKLKRKFKKEVI